MIILFASIFGMSIFDDAFAQSTENESTRQPFIKTDLDSFTPDLDIILFGNVGDLEVPITLEVSCDGIPDSTMYPRLFRGEHQNFEVNESGYFRLSLGTIDFTCDKQISTVTASIQGTDASTSFQMIKWNENIKSTISASTDKTSYQKGDSVIFSGKVTNYEFAKVISYQMKDPRGYYLSMGTISPGSDGIFSHTFGLGGSLWRLDGNYEIKFHYNDDLSTKSTVEYYYSIPDPIETSESEPTEPVPTEPVPTEPVPTEPVPTEPVPTEPVPVPTYDPKPAPAPTSKPEPAPIPTYNPESASLPTSEPAPTSEHVSVESGYVDNVDSNDETAFKQLDPQIQSKVKSYDSKILREQSQYDEYLKLYQYYEGKTLSSSDEQKFQKVVDKLNSQNEKITSLLDERNMLVLESDEVTKIIEEKVDTPQPVKQIEEKPQEQQFCFLFWCW
jgi:hypothetical protein